MNISSFFAGLLTGLILLFGILVIIFTGSIGNSLGFTKSELIQIGATLSTVSVSIVSIWIALKSLKVSKDSLLQSNRPYVVSYISSITTFKSDKYIIIKNYGKSGALIREISLNLAEDYFKNHNKIIQDFFTQYSNSFIAPNQSFQLPLFEFDLVGEISITYVDSHGFIYEEKYEVDSTSVVYYSTHSSTKINDEFQKNLLNLLHNGNRTNL